MIQLLLSSLFAILLAAASSNRKIQGSDAVPESAQDRIVFPAHRTVSNSLPPRPLVPSLPVLARPLPIAGTTTAAAIGSEGGTRRNIWQKQLVPTMRPSLLAPAELTASAALQQPTVAQLPEGATLHLLLPPVASMLLPPFASGARPLPVTRQGSMDHFSTAAAAAPPLPPAKTVPGYPGIPRRAPSRPIALAVPAESAGGTGAADAVDATAADVSLTDTAGTVTVTDTTPEAAFSGTMTINAPMADTVRIPKAHASRVHTHL